MIAHRWAYALTHGLDAMLATTVIRHQCDNPVCQLPEHLVAGEPWQNSIEAYVRREIIGNPLRDVRGSHGRARELRNAARLGGDLDAVDRAGLPEVDRNQPPLL